MLVIAVAIAAHVTARNGVGTKVAKPSPGVPPVINSAKTESDAAT
jgi:hypothetical protein